MSVGRSRSLRAVLIIVVVFAAAGAGYLAVRTGVLKRIVPARTIERLPGTKYQLNQRFNTLWKLAANCIVTYPATGVGIGGYIIESSNFAALKGGELKDLPESAENYFLQVAAELGFPGLAVFAWFFWEIFRKGRKAWRGQSVRSPDRWLLAGALSGLVAYVFNVLTHSYIASYEIKYTFWLMVAVVFVLGGPSEAPATRTSSGSPGPGRARRSAAALAVFLFGAVFLWISAHGLSLARTRERFPIPPDAGIGKTEKSETGREFRWAREYGGLAIRIESAALIVPIHASHPDIAAHPVTVRISLAPDVFHRGTTIKELALSSQEWTEVALDLPASEVGLRRVLFFEVDRTWNPSKTTGAPDSRDLGIALGPVEFR